MVLTVKYLEGIIFDEIKNSHPEENEVFNARVSVLHLLPTRDNPCHAVKLVINHLEDLMNAAIHEEDSHARTEAKETLAKLVWMTRVEKNDYYSEKLNRDYRQTFPATGS